MTVIDFHVGDVLALRKLHPCGGREWTVTRLGADIGLCCATCGRRGLLARPALERQLKAFVTRAAAGPPAPGSAGG